ncbi:response regulator receiver modulated metal dependent phosphohydrolase [Candidatus Vecturithrix granuli]|uniref:Response regulator receiver modulated metal dependent phosphohydrolase n=1 Tax=Vecturithrix granuli TaxID=1499967 RepID=A0A081C9Y6_VECG1|nr:response regulator receiver modulated metal dependent phosphohydrolase [Candidatus Vecturithrix granuli]
MRNTTTPKQTILVVDDFPENLEFLDEVLRPHYKVKVALNGEKAIKIAMQSDAPDLILLDIMMPDMDGYEVCQRLKAQSCTRNIPIIFVTALGEFENEARGFELGAVDYITKPINPVVVRARVRTHLALYDQNRELEQKVQERTSELQATRLEIIRRLGRAAEYKDNETGLHVIRMSHYSRLIAQAAGMNKDDVELLFNAAPMHDVGKIGIPDHILRKPGKLTPEEWELMKRHVKIGARIIGKHSSKLLETARIVALTHHEKWNGTGYPHNLSGEHIPITGRIVAIADVFDALTSVRPYKEAWPVEDALAYIKGERGQHFDPDLVGCFLNVVSEILKVKEKYAE